MADLEPSAVAKRWARAVFPDRYLDGLRVALGRATLPPAGVAETKVVGARYEDLYEAHARALPPESSIGDGDYDLVGRIELSVLVQEGLHPTCALLDFGCGTGRLAAHAIPFLERGAYVGTDIAPTMLRLAEERCAALLGRGASVTWLHQPDEIVPLPDASIDIACAFSVFTHMDHEDMYRYLCEMRRVMKPDGRLVASCLPIHLDDAQQVFLASAHDDARTRWDKVRNVTTSTEQFETVADLAGWTLVRWHDGATASIRMIGDDRMVTLGQSVAVFEVAPAAARG